MGKYIMTETTLVFNGVTLFRIKRLKDGLLGGFIEKESNLSQDDDCFIYDNAKVFGKAMVSGDARVYDNAKVYGNAEVFGDARVCGNAIVYGKAMVSGDARVCGNAEVDDGAQVCDNAEIFGNAMISGKAKVYGNAEVWGNAQISGRAKVYGDATVFGKARVSGEAIAGGNARVSGDAILTSFCNNFTFEEHSITITDNFIRIGCQEHLKTEWPDIIEDLIIKHKVKHARVYRDFIKLFSKPNRA